MGAWERLHCHRTFSSGAVSQQKFRWFRWGVGVDAWSIETHQNYRTVSSAVRQEGLGGRGAGRRVGHVGWERPQYSGRSDRKVWMGVGVGEWAGVGKASLTLGGIGVGCWRGRRVGVSMWGGVGNSRGRVWGSGFGCVGDEKNFTFTATLSGAAQGCNRRIFSSSSRVWVGGMAKDFIEF